METALAHLRAGFRELETVSRILDFQRVFEIHITADSDWADLWLKPRLERFRADSPNTLFCINGVGDVPVRLGEADCEIRFATALDGESVDLLFHDYMLPISSPENTDRIFNQPDDVTLEGFPLLHLECYTFDAGAIGWLEWIGEYGYRNTAPERGIRYKKVMHALEAVYADAGLMVCGLALVKKQLDEGVLSRPFPIEQGAWSKNAYRAIFRESSLRRSNIEQFRAWLLAEAAETQAELAELVARR